MPITINTNVAALNAQRNVEANTSGLNKSLERLASGFRINRAGDDAAGLQISETLRSQIRGSKQALSNAQDGINVLNIVDGAQGVIQDNLQRVRELTVQAANDTLATSQRTAIATEITQRLSDVDRIANSTTFNGVNLLSSSTPTNYFIQLGANNSATNDRIDLVTGLGNTTTGASGLNVTFTASTDIANNSAAQAFLGTLDTALSSLNTKRATLGALSNRLESSLSNLSVSIENLSSAESRIRNVDVATESASLTKNQILQQASTSILSQANQSPSLALSLIGR
jgi:flagellin